MPPFEPEPIVRAVIFLVVLFISSVFWVSYYRVRSSKLLLAAMGFSLLVLSAIVHHTMEWGGPHLAFLELIAFLLFALSFLKMKDREEDEGEQGDASERGDERGTETHEELEEESGGIYVDPEPGGETPDREEERDRDPESDPDTGAPHEE